MLSWRWFAASYGWTPDQVGELPLDTLPWWPVIEEAEAWARQRQMKAEAAAASRANRKR